MSEAPSNPAKATKSRHGFAVGPAHLPDGRHKRTVQKIRKDLIHKASVKRSYAKLKSRELLAQHQEQVTTSTTGEPHEPVEAASLDPHPARQAMIDHDSAEQNRHANKGRIDSGDGGGPSRFTRNPRTNPYSRSLGAAAKEQARREALQQERDRAEQERRQKLDRRDRWRREMAKAKGQGKHGRQGPRKLGRESTVLLEKIQLMTGK